MMAKLSAFTSRAEDATGRENRWPAPDVSSEIIRLELAVPAARPGWMGDRKSAARVFCGLLR